jgi:hypothetical protein
MGYGRMRQSVARKLAMGTLAVVLLGGAIAVGCGLNPQPEPPAGSSAAGAGGAAGSAGNGGLGTGGGSAGVGGTSTGTGGSSSGTGGSGGGINLDGGGGDAAPDGAAPPDFSHCEQAPPSTCSPAATCRALGDCGEATSFLDAYGCLRATCTADADCAAGERCLPTSLVSSCEASTLEGCQPDPLIGCNCSVTADCAARTQCVAETTAPPEADCILTGRSCQELTIQATLVADQLQSGLSSELVDALRACERAIKDALRSACR